MRKGDARPDRRHPDDLFRHGGSHDSMPGIEELIRGVTMERRTTGRPAKQKRNSAYAEVRHPFWLGIKYAIYGLVLILGLFMVIGAGAEAMSYYGKADALAHAPACAQSVDLPSSTENCVGDKLMSYDYGVYHEESNTFSISLNLPTADDPEGGVYVEFPASAEFEDATGDQGTLRATWWQGTIVAMTTGTDDGGAVTVLSNDNPNIQGGTDIGVALMGAVITALALLLFLGSRPIRRWLPRNRLVPYAVSALIVGAIGCFVTAIGLLLQPERVLLAGILSVSLTGVILGFVWLIISKQPSQRKVT